MKLAPLIFLIGVLSFFPGCGDEEESKNPLTLEIIPGVSPILPGTVDPCGLFAGEDEIQPLRLQFAGAKILWADGDDSDDDGNGDDDGDGDLSRILTILEISIEITHPSLSDEYEDSINGELLDRVFEIKSGKVGTATQVFSNPGCHLGFGGIDILETREDLPFSAIGRITLIGISSTKAGLDPRSERAEVDVEINYEP